MTESPASSQIQGVEERAFQLEERGFRSIFEQELSYVWHTLRRLGVRGEDVRDQSQEVFMIVHRLLDQFDRGRPIRPWLFGIAFRVASAYRDKARYRTTEELGDDVTDDAQLPDEQLADAEKRRLVLRALDRIELGRRAVFVLAELEDRSIPEIATELGIPLNTAYSRLRLAREEFADAARRLAKERATGRVGAP